MSAESPRHSNRLANETSPYLLQHAHNPVDWYPWGEEALERARREDKPILLSIGYSACHWCHVMERESFEDEGIARIMNKHFVCIKVDREERPDLDDIYMDATLALNHGQGGWPMTVFLTPAQEPFFAGTYFPPADRYGRPGFPTLLRRLHELWRTRRDALVEQAAQLTEHLRLQARAVNARAVGAQERDACVRQLGASFDPRFGGFSEAPKFPPSTALLLLLRHYRRARDPLSLEMVRKTLDAMAQGGLYDHLGGGFARYSTDERWLVPHFEKMLYDNAQLARVYLEAYVVTRDAEYARVARETLDYVLRDMTSPEGGFYSAQDADSEGVEGKYYVWTPAEVAAVLDAQSTAHFCDYYDITEAGNWEHKSIPHTPQTLEWVARRAEIAPEALRQSIERARQLLLAARQERVPPGLDDKVLTAWNGLMIGAMAEGARVLNDRRYLDAAARAADFLLARLRTAEGSLLRTYRAGRAHVAAFLEDYAYLSEGLVDLYEAGGATSYLDAARALCERAVADFLDVDSGALFDVGAQHETLIVRRREGHDGALPNANATLAHVLARLALHYNRDAWRERAVAALHAYGMAMARAPRAFCRALVALDFLATPPLELVLVGRPGERAYDELRYAVDQQYLPHRVVAHGEPGDGGANALPLLRDKGRVRGAPALYICRDYACQAPITDPTQVAAGLQAHDAALPT